MTTDLGRRRTRRGAARLVRSRGTAEARYLGHPQLGAGEQVVQPRGVERWWRSVDGGEDRS